MKAQIPWPRVFVDGVVIVGKLEIYQRRSSPIQPSHRPSMFRLALMLTASVLPFTLS